MNNGFIQTWFEASEDFSTLLNKSDIGNSIDYTKIKGNANYFNTLGFFLQKDFTYKKYHHFAIKSKFYGAKDIEYLKVKGENSNEQFKLSLDYYYSKRNRISKNNSHDNSYSGYGYGFDLEYIYKNKNLYIYSGILNILGTIHWSSISKMHYDLNSNTIYKDDNGFNKVRPFGIGSYKQNINYKQKLPLYYKSTIDYKIANSSYLGNNLIGNKNTIFNEIYLRKEFKNFAFKTGYIIENKNMNFTLAMPNVKIHISNNFSFSNTILQASYKIDF